MFESYEQDVTTASSCGDKCNVFYHTYVSFDDYMFVVELAYAGLATLAMVSDKQKRDGYKKHLERILKDIKLQCGC